MDNKILSAKQFLESKYSPMKRDTNDLYDGVSLDNLIDFAKLHAIEIIKRLSKTEAEFQHNINYIYPLSNIK